MYKPTALSAYFCASLIVMCSGVSQAVMECTHFDSNMGAHFDLSELQRSAGQPAYKIEDGDIPCTPNVESN